MHRPPSHRVPRARRPRAAAALATVLALAGCAPAASPPTPAPPPADSARLAARVAADSARRESARRDSVRRELARRDSVREAAARRDSARRAAEAPVRERARVPAARPVPATRATRAGIARATPLRAGELRVCAGGDVTLGTNLDTTWVATASRRAGEPVPALPRPAELLQPLTPLVQGADLVLLNVEAAIGAGRAPRKCPPGSRACFALRQPVSAAAALREVAPGAVVVANVANNHARDAGTEGFERTREHLEAAGVYVTGADTLPTLVPLGGDTVAVLGFTTSTAGPDARDLAAVRRHVARAAARHDRVIVTVHMGAEGVRAQRTRARVERYFNENRGDPVAFARTAVRAGAALVIGHGPHVLRALEWRGDALVAYSLGNLINHGPFLLHEPLNRGALLCATMGPRGAVRDAIVTPTYQRRVGLVAFDPDLRALTLLDSLGRLDFPRSGGRVDEHGRVRAPDGRLRVDPP
ncbi:MAG TPA: CapA family protein [Gemmatimonadaceae bacterium]